MQYGAPLPPAIVSFRTQAAPSGNVEDQRHSERAFHSGMKIVTIGCQHVQRIWRAARAVSRNDDAAWDCVQEAFLTALVVKRKIADEDAVAWLCGVARNHARHWTRGNERRLAAHERLAKQQRPRAPVDRLTLNDALAQLPATKRDAVVLRYLTRRTFAEVAEAQGITEAAAKARVRSGLAALRSALGAAVATALLATAAVAGVAPSLAQAAAGGAAPRWLPVTAVACLVVVATLLAWWPDRGTGSFVRGSAVDVSPIALLRDGQEPAVLPKPVAAQQRKARAVTVLKGVVADESGEPVVGAEVTVVADVGGMRPQFETPSPPLPPRSVRTGVDGAFVVDMVEGLYRVDAVAPDARRGTVKMALPLAGPIRVVVREVTRRDIVVRVIDPARVPVPNARIEIVASRRRRAQPYQFQGVTDARGELIAPSVGASYAIVRATAADGRCGWCAGHQLDTADAESIVLTVDRAGVLSGGLHGVPEDALADAVVVAHQRVWQVPYLPSIGWTHEAPVQAGRYRFDALPAGPYTLSLRSPAGVRLVLPPFSSGGTPLPNSLDAPRAAVASGAVTTCNLEVTPGGTIAGVVRTARGPVTGARVDVAFVPLRAYQSFGYRIQGAEIWRLESMPMAESPSPLVVRSALTGADGSYSVAGLPPGLHRVEVFARGLSYDRRDAVRVEDGEPVMLAHELARAGMLQIATSFSRIGVVRAGAPQPNWIAYLPLGEGMTVAGLEPGVHDIVALDAKRGFVRIGSATIEAGRTTWVDARGGGPVRVRGRVTGPAGPLAGASVANGYGWCGWTGSDGAFEFGLPFAATYVNAFLVRNGPLEWQFDFAPMHAREKRWSGELRMGDHAVALRTVDSDGAPVSAVWRLASARRTRGAPWLREGSGRTGANGYAGLENLSPGPYEGEVRFPNGVRAPVRFRVPAAAAVTVRAPAAGTLSIRARHNDRHGGRPTEGALVVVYVWSGDGPAPRDNNELTRRSVQRSGHTDRHGALRIQGCVAGTAVVHVFPPNSRRLDAMAIRRVTVVPNQTTALVVETGAAD